MHFSARARHDARLTMLHDPDSPHPQTAWKMVRSQIYTAPEGLQRVPSIVVIGESLIDIVDSHNGHSITPGGGPANVALVLGRLQHDVTLSTALGDDEHGETIRAWLTESNVKIQATLLPKTSVAHARLDSSGAAEYEFQINWTLGNTPLPPSQLVHAGSIGSWHPPGTWRVETLLERARVTSTISFDPNIRPSLIRDPTATRKRIDRLLNLADIVKLSDEDLEWLRPNQPAAQTAAEWCNAGRALVVITRGAAGATAYTDRHVTEIPGTTVTVADTIGAGDTFMGTLLASLADRDLLGANRREALHQIDRHTLSAMVQRSVDAAAITVSRRGANPPWLHDSPPIR